MAGAGRQGTVPVPTPRLPRLFKPGVWLVPTLFFVTGSRHAGAQAVAEASATARVIASAVRVGGATERGAAPPGTDQGPVRPMLAVPPPRERPCIDTPPPAPAAGAGADAGAAAACRMLVTDMP